MRLRNYRKANEDHCCSRVCNYTLDTLRLADTFGEPVGLNLKGRKTIRTLPGALLTIIMIASGLFYGFLKFQHMYYSSDWSLLQQTILQEPKDANRVVSLGKTYPNISLALEIERKLTLSDQTTVDTKANFSKAMGYFKIQQIQYKTEKKKSATVTKESTTNDLTKLTYNKYGHYEAKINLKTVKI